MEPAVHKWLDALVIVLSYPVAKLEGETLSLSIATNSFRAFRSKNIQMNFELDNENVKSPLFWQSWLSHQGNLHPLPKAFPACVDVSEQAAKCHHWTLGIIVLVFQSQTAKLHYWTLGIIVLC